MRIRFTALHRLPAPAQLQLFCQSPKAALKVGVFAIDHPGAGHHYNVIAGEQSLLLPPVELPDPAACPVALDCVAQFDAGGDAQAAV